MSRWDSTESFGPVERVVDAPISRRRALQTGALAAGALAGLSLADAAPALAWWGSQPRPIPGGFDQNFNPVPVNPFIHVLPPDFGFEMSTITDFQGVVVAGEVQGTARGTDGSTRSFDCDMRFMKGTYVGRDGRKHKRSFGFI